ncbi:MAG: shikimate kinase [Thermoplasmata archaeon]|nr:shikimate kinase [Thermoplasmata archaeon]
MGGDLRGVGSAFGAVSFVNAMLCGQGCAAGISLGAEAELSLEESPRTTPTIRISAGSDTPLVRAALGSALRRFAPETPFSAELSLRSNIPPARGLKSSSAVASAIFRATENALRTPKPASSEELAGCVADVGLAVGLSATGGFDDALAGLESGVVVTENVERRLLSRTVTPPEWELLLWVPRDQHLPAPELRAELAKYVNEGKEAIRLARDGRFLEAMERNTRAVERALGVDHRPLHAELRRRGALGSGLSGLGPSLAVVVQSDRRRTVRAGLPTSGGELLNTSFVAPRDRSP